MNGIMPNMQPELAKLRRRPLFLPLVVPFVLAAIVVLFVVWVLDARTSTVVVVVPHAEVETAAGADPALSAAGRERALRLARALGQSGERRGVDAIFASEYQRTQQTAIPLAESLGLAVNAVSNAAWRSLAATIRRQHNGEMVLVVGNAATVPELVHALSGEQVVLSDGEYDAMYMMYLSRLSKPRLVKLRY